MNVEMTEAVTEIFNAWRASGCVNAAIQPDQSACSSRFMIGSTRSSRSRLPSSPKTINVGFRWRLMV